MTAQPKIRARRAPNPEGRAGSDRWRPEPASPPRAAPAMRSGSSSERGGWSLLGRLLMWAMRNNCRGGT
jgi:hypothetical protein